jgi:cytochrome P450
VTAVTNFIAVLLLFPDVQAKVQAEFDAVIGGGRLPVLEDKPRLPYLHAVLKEVLRWRPLVPTGIPHMTSEEDVYKGYYVPKGAVVIGNSW